MALEREANAVAEGMKGLFGLVRGELAAAKDVLASLRGELVAVREELTRQKERVLMLERGSLAAENEVNALRRALGAVGERSAATAAVVEKRGRELAAVKGELIEVKAELSGVKGEVTAVKGELAEHKGDMAEKWDMVERRRESDLRGLCGKARKRRAVTADASPPENVDTTNSPAPLSEEDKAFKKQMFRPWIKASTVHDAWRIWNSPFGDAGLTLRDEMAAGGFTKKYALVKAEDSALTRQKRLMAAVSEYAAAQHDGFEHVIRILDEIGARIGFTSLRDGLVVRSAKVCPETFADLRMSKPACEKAIVALELARAGLEDEAWGQQQYPNSWSSWPACSCSSDNPPISALAALQHAMALSNSCPSVGADSEFEGTSRQQHFPSLSFPAPFPPHTLPIPSPFLPAPLPPHTLPFPSLFSPSPPLPFPSSSTQHISRSAGGGVHEDVREH
ncbi:unnamed protein product [Closterium sp. NIES-65]|nr:unnamed protein product [Closterium sp. NIES-65]